MSQALRSLLFCAACGLVAAACDPRFVRPSDLRPAEVQRLAGLWEGRGSLNNMDSSNRCPRVYRISMEVGGGNVSGEMINDATPTTTPATFTSFLEYDGSFHAFVRVDTREMNILGAFSRDSFTGTARSTDCRYALRLRRRDTPAS
jgi:hypothetical protein